MIAEQKKLIDIRSIIENAGIRLTQGAGRYIGLCPFHDDHSPSLVVYQHHFHCYSCIAHGDVIDFLMLFYGCDFNEACRHLGLKKGPISKIQIIEQQKKCIKRDRCQRRESDLAFTLAILIRTTRQVIANIKTVEDLEANADLLHALPFWKHCHYILSQADQTERRKVVDALADVQTATRHYLFRLDFHYREWLRETFPESKEPRNERKRETGSA